MKKFFISIYALLIISGLLASCGTLTGEGPDSTPDTVSCTGAPNGYNENNVTNNTPTNLVEAAICSGAETVLAFSKKTYTTNIDVWFIELFRVMYMRNISLSSAISFMNNENIHYTEGDSSTYGEASDIAVIGGNGNLKLSDLFN